MSEFDAAGKPLGAGGALRRWFWFQLKLTADALRDFVLSPVSTICILADLVLRNDEDRSLFRRLMVVGQRTDRFINLFDHDGSGNAILSGVIADAERTLRRRHETAIRAASGPLESVAGQDMKRY
jgi:hypothetical protein